MNVEIMLEVPAGPKAAAYARRSLEGLRAHVRPPIFDDIRLLVSELVSNSARHAGLREGTPIRVCVNTTRNHIRTEVTDPGQGFEERAERSDQSGWGLTLVERIAQRWGIKRRGGTTVWFDIDTAKDEGPAFSGTSRHSA